jgi:hypothetical protein
MTPSAASKTSGTRSAAPTSTTSSTATAAGRLAGRRRIGDRLRTRPEHRWESHRHGDLREPRLVVRSWIGGEDGGYDIQKMQEQARGVQRIDWDPLEQVVRAEPFFSYVVHDAIAEAGRGDLLTTAMRSWTAIPPRRVRHLRRVLGLGHAGSRLERHTDPRSRPICHGNNPRHSRLCCRPHRTQTRFPEQGKVCGANTGRTNHGPDRQWGNPYPVSSTRHPRSRGRCRNPASGWGPCPSVRPRVGTQAHSTSWCRPLIQTVPAPWSATANCEPGGISLVRGCWPGC